MCTGLGEGGGGSTRGLRAVTRILRSLRSVVKVREGTHCRFGCAVHTERGRSCHGNDRRIQNDRTSILKERKRFLHGEQKTLDVGVENLVEVLFGDCAERCKFSGASVGEENVYAALLLLYACV